jgi:hypothetical protein
VPDQVRRSVGWLLAPATEDVPRQQVAGAVVLRVLLGLMWLHNVSWKRPPDFGEDSDSGLYHFTALAVSDPVFPPYSRVVEEVVLPTIEVFGWGVLAAETALAVMLLTGAWVRVAALLGVAQSVAIALSVAAAPNEWPWSYWLMIGAHLAILLSSAGRGFAVDAVRAGVASARRLGTVWGIIALLAGTGAAVGAADDPTAAAGHYLRAGDLAVSLGRFNLVGALAVVLLGALLLAAARLHTTAPGWAAAAVAVLAAASLYAQVGFTDPLLGGNATSAAFFLCLAVVAVTVSRKERA